MGIDFRPNGAFGRVTTVTVAVEPLSLKQAFKTPLNGIAGVLVIQAGYKKTLGIQK